jgi:hypothetical protein
MLGAAHVHFCAGDGRMKLKGKENMPIRKESEKFSVASAERNMPSSRREKHFIRVKWVFVGANDFVRSVHSSAGRAMLRMLKM